MAFSTPLMNSNGKRPYTPLGSDDSASRRTVNRISDESSLEILSNAQSDFVNARNTLAQNFSETLCHPKIKKPISTFDDCPNSTTSLVNRSDPMQALSPSASPPRVRNVLRQPAFTSPSPGDEISYPRHYNHPAEVDSSSPFLSTLYNAVDPPYTTAPTSSASESGPYLDQYAQSPGSQHTIDDISFYDLGWESFDSRDWFARLPVSYGVSPTTLASQHNANHTAMVGIAGFVSSSNSTGQSTVVIAPSLTESNRMGWVQPPTFAIQSAGTCTFQDLVNPLLSEMMYSDSFDRGPGEKTSLHSCSTIGQSPSSASQSTLISEPYITPVGDRPTMGTSSYSAQAQELRAPSSMLACYRRSDRRQFGAFTVTPPTLRPSNSQLATPESSPTINAQLSKTINPNSSGQSTSNKAPPQPVRSSTKSPAPSSTLTDLHENSILSGTNLSSNHLCVPSGRQAWCGPDVFFLNRCSPLVREDDAHSRSRGSRSTTASNTSIANGADAEKLSPRPTVKFPTIADATCQQFDEDLILYGGNLTADPLCSGCCAFPEQAEHCSLCTWCQVKPARIFSMNLKISQVRTIGIHRDLSEAVVLAYGEFMRKCGVPNKYYQYLYFAAPGTGPHRDPPGVGDKLEYTFIPLVSKNPRHWSLIVADHRSRHAFHFDVFDNRPPDSGPINAQLAEGTRQKLCQFSSWYSVQLWTLEHRPMPQICTYKNSGPAVCWALRLLVPYLTTEENWTRPDVLSRFDPCTMDDLPFDPSEARQRLALDLGCPKEYFDL